MNNKDLNELMSMCPTLQDKIFLINLQLNLESSQSNRETKNV